MHLEPSRDADETQTPVINIYGTRVALGPPRHDLLETYLRWRNDFDVMRQLGDVEPLTMEQEIERYERLAQETTTVRFTIYERASHSASSEVVLTGVEKQALRPIGSTSLYGIDEHNRTAEFSILIGEADCRGKGYGTEATHLMLDYAFTGLGLHSIFLRVFAFNPAAKRAYEKAGFREIGRRSESQFMGGRLWDTIYMDCLASEFQSPVLGTLFV